MLLDYVRLKIGNFLGPLGTGKVEEKRSLDDRHFDGAQAFVHVHEIRHGMSRNLVDSPGLENAVNLVFTLESVKSVEEFDRGKPICSQDNSVLSRPCAEIFQQSAVVF